MTELPVISKREAWYRTMGYEYQPAIVGQLHRNDSLEKLLYHLACLAPEQELVYRGKRLVPVPPTRITVGPSVFRQFTCVDACHSCCLPITLDYTPYEFEQLSEEMKQRVPWQEREVEVSGVQRSVWTFNQAVLPSCPFLTFPLPHGGLGCALWPRSPMECAAAPQITIRYRKPGHGSITKQPFGRGWMFVPPAMCQFDEVSERSTRFILQKDAMLLERYAHWAAYFEVDTVLPKAAGLFRSYRDSSIPVPSPRSGTSIVLYP